VSAGETSATTPASRSAAHQLRLLLGDRLVAVAVLVVTSTLAGLSEAAILAIVAEVAGALVSGAHHVHASFGPVHLTVTIGGLLAIAFAIAIVRLGLQAPLSLLPANIAAEVQSRLQREVFDAYTRAAWSEQSRDREGALQELMTNQIQQAAGGALAASGFVVATLTLVVLIFSALLVNAITALTVIATAVILFLVLRPLNQTIHRWGGMLSQAQMDFASGVGQATRLAEETHVFGVAAAQRATMGGYIDAARKFFYRVQMLGRVVPNVYQSCIYLLVVGMLAVLSAVHAGHIAALGAVVLLIIRAGGYGQAVQGAYQALRGALPFVERVQDVADRYAASEPVRGELSLETIESLEFERVSFAYTPEREVLHELSFAVAGGEAIGVVGPSGAGKSTLMQLLLQLREPTAGRYLVNGREASQVRPHDWHVQVAYVPQEPRLLHATVAQNIRFFRQLDDAAVERAARLARIEHDIESWPAGYDTLIGPRADAISGGQQQRICIARALAAHPAMLVLDEPTSALDPRSESLLQESLIALKDELTLFVIAHRMSTLDICDRVMVILDGRLDAFDAAASLKRQAGYYSSALSLSGVGLETRDPDRRA
jgi:ABC-type multidrug transport system fused ATPase/permease subunit